MKKLYGHNETDIYPYAKERYSPYMSYAQGYLFYYAYPRTKIGKS